MRKRVLVAAAIVAALCLCAVTGIAALTLASSALQPPRVVWDAEDDAYCPACRARVAMKSTACQRCGRPFTWEPATCHRCGGSGHLGCPKCKGEKHVRERCPNCEDGFVAYWGDRPYTVRLSPSGAYGKLRGKQADAEYLAWLRRTVQGRADVPLEVGMHAYACPVCDRSGWQDVTCRACEGSGSLRCSRCAGAGKVGL